MPTYFTSEHAMSMTLRDYFAGQAMRGFMQQELTTPTYEKMADACYKLADAMLKARSK